MFHLVYVSSAIEPFTRDALLELLQRCRASNARAGITGLLLYREGNFLQVLEGEEREVRSLAERIRGDVRHRGMIVLLAEPIAAREFPEWSMAFRDLDAEDLSELPGYDEFLNTPLREEEFGGRPTRVARLLGVFKRSFR